MRGLMVFVMLTACAVDAPPNPEPLGVGLSAIELVDSIDSIDTEMTTEAPVDPDLCALAAELPADDLCSLVCDPAALHQAMLDSGAVTGRCYLLLCQLSESVHATVGVCLVE